MDKKGHKKLQLEQTLLPFHHVVVMVDEMIVSFSSSLGQFYYFIFKRNNNIYLIQSLKSIFI